MGGTYPGRRAGRPIRGVGPGTFVRPTPIPSETYPIFPDTYLVTPKTYPVFPDTYLVTPETYPISQGIYPIIRHNPRHLPQNYLRPTPA